MSVTPEIHYIIHCLTSWSYASLEVVLRIHTSFFGLLIFLKLSPFALINVEVHLNILMLKKEGHPNSPTLLIISKDVKTNLVTNQ